MSNNLTPLPVGSVRVLSIVCTVGAVGSMLWNLPEKDHRGADHVFSAVQRKIRSGWHSLTSVDEVEAARIRECQARRRGA